MRQVCAPLALFAFVLTLATAQQPSPSAVPAQAVSPLPLLVKLFNGVQDAVQPALLPLVVKEPPDPACDGIKQNGSVQFALIVDAGGHPRNIVIERATGNGIDYLALQTVEDDRFHPATFNGDPVAAKGTLAIHLEVCTEKSKNAGFFPAMRYRSMPEQKFESLPAPQEDAQLAPIYNSQDERRTHAVKAGGEIIPPKLILQPEVDYSDYGRENHIQGPCSFSLIVDEHGLPRDIKVITPIEPSMLTNAAKAVLGYRFKPATKNGMPVPVSITIEIDFHTTP
jgi:outer membrane biosynthesis protein TonB